VTHSEHCAKFAVWDASRENFSADENMGKFEV
jgi:hypothetical protein